MKRFLIGATAGAVMIGSMVAPAFAGNGKEDGEQPGYSHASQCGAGHGSFGYFGQETNLGVNSLGPGTPVYHDGATGQETGATGYNNSQLCGNPQS